MSRLSAAKRARICALLQAGHSSRTVAALENVCQSTVIRTCQRVGERGDYEDRPRSGRPKVLSVHQERIIVRKVMSGKCSTAVGIQRSLTEEDNVDISTSSVRRVLYRSGLAGRIKVKKPLLKKKHRQARLAFARKYRHWTIDDWNRVIWSDESKFQLFGSDGKEYCWRMPGEPLRPHHVKPTVKHGGGNIMVWGCMTSQGLGYLCRIDAGLDAELYGRILDDELMQTLSWYKLRVEDVVFQHDNDPKHTASSTKQWLSDHKFSVLHWPAQSPDLNPIEHLWNEVERRLRNLPNPPRCREDLWEKIQDVWNSIETDVCTKLVGTMTERIRDVIKAKGGYTKW